MTDPLKTYDSGVSSPPPPVSSKTYPIAGILTTVFGLDELPADASDVACLWLLHPRLATQERMTPIASAVISDWNKRLREGRAGGPVKGLIAVAFDQRNHGSRLVDPLGNEAWRQGNPRHAQDMFAVFQGTARDVSLLMDYLPSYIFPNSERRIPEHLVLGVSLGGHAAWSCLLHEPRVSAGVVIIGCPDYVNLMVDRARLSKIPSWTSSDPPGAQILGSEAFPTSLLETIRRYDPASYFLSHMEMGADAGPIRSKAIPEPSEKEKQALRPVLTRCLAGKRIMNLSGGVDKLVPYHKGEIFLTWLKQAIAPDGWFADGAVTFEDIIDQSAGHEVTPKMVDEAVRFIGDALAASNESKKSGSVRESKI
ncbi:hypothetical protein ATERTT37_000227 [Aspergillus terreus]|nr:hypothetical protein HFD88_005643 [Aspergillus terreus]